MTEVKIGQLWAYSFKDTVDEIHVVVERGWNSYHKVTMCRIVSLRNPEIDLFQYIGGPCWKLYQDVP